MKKLILLLTLAVVTFAGVQNASAQAVPPYKSNATSVAGIVVPAYCGADSLIQYGTWVMIDTTTAATTNQKRIVVVPFNGLVVNRYRVIGIAATDFKRNISTATGHRGAPGSVLIWGYHPYAKFGSSTQAGNLPIKVGPSLYGKATVASDTLSCTIGWLIGPASGNTAANPRAQVFITRSGAPTSLLAN